MTLAWAALAAAVVGTAVGLGATVLYSRQTRLLDDTERRLRNRPRWR
jgi:hypothetical protein